VFSEKINNYIVLMDTNLLSKMFSKNSEEFYLAIINLGEIKINKEEIYVRKSETKLGCVMSKPRTQLE
jgi:hypothetical protein